MDGVQPPPHQRHDPHSHEEVASYFPEYVAEILAGGSPEARYPHVATHLATCAACSLDLDELLLLTMATYDDQGDDPPAASLGEAEVKPLPLAPPPRLPPPLGEIVTRHPPPEPPGVWRRDRQGAWVVTLSPGLLARGAHATLAGAARADDLLYDLLVPPEGGAPELRVEVYRAGDEVYLRVAVDTLDPDALDMGEVEVTATAGERVWRARTNGLGLANLRGIPRQALDGLELGITAGR